MHVSKAATIRNQRRLLPSGRLAQSPAEEPDSGFAPVRLAPRRTTFPVRQPDPLLAREATPLPEHQRYCPLLDLKDLYEACAGLPLRGPAARPSLIRIARAGNTERTMQAKNAEPERPGL